MQHALSSLKKTWRCCTRCWIFHIISNFTLSGKQMMCFLQENCVFGEILDPFSSFLGFQAEFWYVFCKRFLPHGNIVMCSTRKVLLKAIKRTKNTSWEYILLSPLTSCLILASWQLQNRWFAEHLDCSCFCTDEIEALFRNCGSSCGNLCMYSSLFS